MTDIDIFNTTTQKFEIFSLWHPENLQRYSFDFILNANDENIKYNKEEERYEADEETLAWWRPVIEARAESDEILGKIIDRYGLSSWRYEDAKSLYDDNIGDLDLQEHAFLTALREYAKVIDV
jgi:hypothetical protein